MKELNKDSVLIVSGGVEVPMPSLGDALVAIAKEILNAIR